MKHLTRTEERVMQLFWKFGASTISALIDRMKDPKPPHSTISSLARILEKKGFLDHKTYGRTFEYFPIIQKQDYRKNSVYKLAASYFNGSVEEMVSFLVSEKRIDRKTLENLIDELDKNEL
jgi:BlaI family penicillinase repressor